MTGEYHSKAVLYGRRYRSCSMSRKITVRWRSWLCRISAFCSVPRWC